MVWVWRRYENTTGSQNSAVGYGASDTAKLGLNESQHQAAKIRALEQQVAELKDLKQQIALMSAALRTLQAKDQFVAQR
jgi:hypothetical protein